MWKSIGARNASEPAPAWKYAGTIAPGGAIEIPYNPDLDRDVEVAPMPYSASGQPAFSSIDHAFEFIGQTLPHQRETNAPVIGQNKAAQIDNVEIGITNFTRFARLRRVTISDQPDMSNVIKVLYFTSQDYIDRELPRYFTLLRSTSGDITAEDGTALTTEAGNHLQTEAGTSVLPATVYLTVAHSGGTAWTPESNILPVTFAGSSTPGSTGSFDPTPRDSGRYDTL